jgi:hypothetical protein
MQTHVLELFRSNQLTGYSVKPASLRIVGRPSRGPIAMFELTVTGWGGLAHADSGVAQKQMCPSCGLLEYSGVSDMKSLISIRQWDGSDFFMVWPLPTYIFLSARAAGVIRRARFRGAKLQALHQWDEDLPGSSIGVLAPGRLSYWMPEPRAKLLGEPLGIH